MKVRYTKLKIRNRIEKSLGIFMERSFRDGHSVCSDLNKTGCAFLVVFDVGAHIGLSALKFRAGFPRASIYCFEPVKETYDILKMKMSKLSNIEFHQVALGNFNGKKIINLNTFSDTNSFIKSNKKIGTEEVEVISVDSFAKENNIAKIDLLKIDAQGFELEVLKGAEAMMLADQIPFLLVELGFHQGVNNHMLFDDVTSFLFPKGYAVYGFYNQLINRSGHKRLRCANVCFIKKSALNSIK